ncbi:MAG: type II secretion system protein [Dehalococcoidales bacterium]|jgi:prepilin-type N-terminal cleavage/methylation domain-containing protein
MPKIKPLITRINDQRGFGLAETLVAVAVLGTAVVAFVVSLSAGSLAVSEQDKETVAQTLAQTQMEYIKNYPFNPGAATYPAVAAPAGYTITINVNPVSGTDTNIQKITVNILRSGTSIFLVSDYKVKR